MKLPNAGLVLLLALITIISHGQDTQVYSSSRSNHGENFSLRNNNVFSNFNVEIRGKVELSDDDKDVKSMSADGYLEITKTVFGSRRSIVISPEGNGLKREYYDGRTKIAFEPEGRKWLAEILPELVRSTTIGAESRVNRFYRQSGSKGVLEEIARLESDYVKAHYANVLMGLNVPVSDYALITTQVSRAMDSDYYLSEFLQKNISKFMQSKEATEAVFAATKKIDSDHYKTEVIKEALRSGPASAESIKIIMEATSDMESDHYKTQVITALLKQDNLSEPAIAEMVNASKSIGSDYYRSVVLKKALSKSGLSSASYQKILESAKEIGSDHYKTEVLTSLLSTPLSLEALNSVIEVSSTIESDHYSTQVANEIVKRQNLSDDGFQKLLVAMGNHESDFYVSTFLQNALERPSLSKANILAILQAAGNIESDHYLTEVLVDVAPKINSSNDSALKDAYRAAAKKIESETYYGRALRAID